MTAVPLATATLALLELNDQDMVIGTLSITGGPLMANKLADGYAQRIGLQIASSRRVIVSEVVVVQPCLPIEELAWEAQVVGKSSAVPCLSGPY